MLKPLFIFILSLLVFQITKAQKPDTLIYYLKDNGQLVSTKDSCDYYRIVILHGNKTDKKLYPVKDFYKNGQLKMTAISTKKTLDAEFYGQKMDFYANGKCRSVENYGEMDRGEDKTTYYPNGQVYSIEKFNNESFLVECQDSTGRILAKNGKGNWLILDDDNKNIIGEGAIQNGVKVGEWHGITNDTIKYTCNYTDGKITSGTSFDKYGKTYTFTEIISPPVVNGIPLNQFVSENLNYPLFARENNIQGKVIVSFVIENDGTITHLKFIREADQSLGDEVLRLFGIVVYCKPAKRYGIPINSTVQKPYILPLSFALSADN